MPSSASLSSVFRGSFWSSAGARRIARTRRRAARPALRIRTTRASRSSPSRVRSAWRPCCLRARRVARMQQASRRRASIASRRYRPAHARRKGSDVPWRSDSAAAVSIARTARCTGCDAAVRAACGAAGSRARAGRRVRGARMDRSRRPDRRTEGWCCGPPSGALHHIALSTHRSLLPTQARRERARSENGPALPDGQKRPLSLTGLPPEYRRWCDPCR